jgi:hypothetical protein
VHLQPLKAAAHHEVEARDASLLPQLIWLSWQVRRRQHLHTRRCSSQAPSLMSAHAPARASTVASLI